VYALTGGFVEAGNTVQILSQSDELLAHGFDVGLGYQRAFGRRFIFGFEGGYAFQRTHMHEYYPDVRYRINYQGGWSMGYARFKIPLRRRMLYLDAGLMGRYINPRVTYIEENGSAYPYPFYGPQHVWKVIPMGFAGATFPVRNVELFARWLLSPSGPNSYLTYGALCFEVGIIIPLHGARNSAEVQSPAETPKESQGLPPVKSL
jgi:hypothetical protein